MGLLDWVRHKLGVQSPSRVHIDASAEFAECFHRGMKEGEEDPIIWLDEEGILHSRALTPDEMRAVAACRQIVANAFPGYFDDFDGEGSNDR